jgi:hypothetical protein
LQASGQRNPSAIQKQPTKNLFTGGQKIGNVDNIKSPVSINPVQQRKQVNQQIDSLMK